MKQEIRNKIIAENNPLTLEIAKALIGRTVSICCRDIDGSFKELVDTVNILNVAKVTGKKNQYVLLDQYGGFSYHCNGKLFKNGNCTAYFIAY